MNRIACRYIVACMTAAIGARIGMAVPAVLSGRRPKG